MKLIFSPTDSERIEEILGEEFFARAKKAKRAAWLRLTLLLLLLVAALFLFINRYPQVCNDILKRLA